MTSPSIVRKAVPADEDELWRLFKLHHAENALFSLSESKARWYLNRVLYPERIAADDAGPRGWAGVVGAPGHLEAAAVLFLGSAWYTDDLGVDDCMIFVDPQHRRSNHAKVLMAYCKHLIDKGREVNPRLLLMLGVVSTDRTEAKVRLYSRHFDPVGAFFMYPPRQPA